MRLLPVGRSAWLVEVESTEAALAVYDAARGAGIEATDVVPAARTVLFDGLADPAPLRTLLASPLSPAADARTSPREVELPTSYDGPDLDSTAALLGMDPEDLVTRHIATRWRVAFCGFSPGFAYCTGLDLCVPRLETPRPQVPAGAVGLAGEFTGVYPSSSPGGWRLVGRTDAPLWDLARDQPALLAPGTVVRFVAV